MLHYSIIPLFIHHHQKWRIVHIKWHIKLENLRIQLKSLAKESIEKGTSSIFDTARSERVPIFSSWYFSYPTTYTLMSEAISAAFAHQIPWRRKSANCTFSSFISNLCFIPKFVPNEYFD